jgi:glutamate/tyrosine decarboxylase-like PLP-dependent enzyme
MPPHQPASRPQADEDRELTLDPADWSATRALAHRIVDDAIDHLSQVRDQPVWCPTPEDVAARLRQPAPRQPVGAEAAYREFQELIQPWQLGNTHPRFWGWFMGNGTAIGALGDFLASILNPNLGGGNQVASLVESQVVGWCREFLGLPSQADGLLVSGASMANLVGLAVARTAAAPIDVRSVGVAALPKPLRFYASTEVHSCVQKALELLGHGSQSLCKLPVDERYRVRVDAIESQIAADRAAGLSPCAVVGSAGTINTGAVDDLAALAALCRRERLWFHVDGAIGAVLALSERHRGLVAGIEQADSIALDLHKWLHVPFEAGCALVRDQARHRATFALTPAYLAQASRGLASGTRWFSDYGVELSRGFRALKIWFAFKDQGLELLGRLIDQNIEQARELARLIDSEVELERLAPVDLNIVCFRYRLAGADVVTANALNGELLIRLHESGVAVPSYTTLGERYCLRVAIANHRTRREDLALLVQAVLKIGRDLAGRGPAAAAR